MSKSPLLLTFLVIFIVIHTKAQLLAPECKDEFPNCDRWLAQCFDDVGMQVVCKRSCGFCGNEEQTEDLTQYIRSGRLLDDPDASNINFQVEADRRNISPELRARRRKPKPISRPNKKPGGSSNKNTGGSSSITSIFGGSPNKNTGGSSSITSIFGGSPNKNTDGSSSITGIFAEALAGGAAEGVAGSGVDWILRGDDESGDETGLKYGGGECVDKLDCPSLLACKENNMQTNCQKSCGLCEGEEECVDRVSICRSLLACEHNTMKTDCQKSCGLCERKEDQYVTESGEPCVATKGTPATCGKHGYDYVWCWTSSWDITYNGWSKCKRNINPSSRRLRPSRPSRPINPNTGGSSSNIIDSIVEGVVGGVEDSVGDGLLWNGASDDDANGRKYGGRDGFYLDREMD